MNDMVHDIDMILEEHKGKITRDVISANYCVITNESYLGTMNHKS